MDAVGLDLDGTLAVTARDREELLRAACWAVDAPAIDREEYARAHRRHGGDGRTRAPVFRAVLDGRPDAGDVDGQSRDLARAYRERVNDALRPVEGAERTIRRLREEYAVGLLTDGPSRAQRSKLRALGWTDLFDAVLVGGELPAGKPDRRAFAALLDALDADPGRTAYVGDDPGADVAGATDAGLRVVQVLDADADPDPRADASVRRSDLPDRLPGAIREA